MPRTPSRPLPADGHTHSEWSWDASAGSMEGSCARAVELGLPSIAFTEHVDHTRWVMARGRKWWLGNVAGDRRFEPPPLDADGYLACLERCRARFPGLVIRSGVELGEPHWHAAATRALLASGVYERVLGSQHCVEVEGRPRFVPHIFDDPDVPLGPANIVRAHLAETLRLVEGFDGFGVLAHIDYAARYWPLDVGPFDPQDFAEEFRAVLRALAASGRVLEINTVVPLAPAVVGWWREVGGRAVAFASDAHRPGAVARGFSDAAAMAEAAGFRPADDPHDFWLR